ncbi:hypothetical protein TNCT_136471 [Trichonephila clavata]|uniref:CCHC-type domain-containing protein n=1 Tax=Trichonephila clavata TaxID=2740835 RepID=A0A8X6HBE2_TRICU|nr:hypothetical protein TNCT_136471 [Trichonephila clavata]
MAFLIRSRKIDLIQLARDLDESPDPSMSKIVLRDLITSSKYYKELLEVIAAERLETEQQQKLELQKQLSIERLRLEVELSRNVNQSPTQNNGQASRVKSLDEIVKMVRLLTVKVPNKSDGKNFDKPQIPEIKKFTCFTCGSDKHFKRDCPKNKGIDNKRLNVNKVSTEGVG